jgi:hypothetical protein
VGDQAQKPAGKQVLGNKINCWQQKLLLGRKRAKGKDFALLCV